MASQKVACLALGFLGVFGSAASASERAAQLLNSFQVMCTLTDLNFAASDAKATAMHLPVRKELATGPDERGFYVKSKSWLLPLTSGPHEFAVAEGLGPRGMVKSCVIGEPKVPGDDIKQEIVRTMKLGEPESSVNSPDGAFHVTTWKYGYKDYKLVLTDASPKNRPGFYLMLVEQPPVKKK